MSEMSDISPATAHVMRCVLGPMLGLTGEGTELPSGKMNDEARRRFARGLTSRDHEVGCAAGDAGSPHRRLVAYIDIKTEHVLDLGGDTFAMVGRAAARGLWSMLCQRDTPVAKGTRLVVVGDVDVTCVPTGQIDGDPGPRVRISAFFKVRPALARDMADVTAGAA